MNIVFKWLGLTSALALVALGGACGGGGDGSSSVSSNFLIKDAAVDDLLSFSASVESLVLVKGGGAETVNLLGAPVQVEFLSLKNNPFWLAHRKAPAGTYTAMRAQLQTGSIRALDKAGSTVAVNAVSHTLTAMFPAPVKISKGVYHRLTLDLDLSDSLSGEVTSPPLDFDPRGVSIDDDGNLPEPIDEIVGIVTATNEAEDEVTVDAFVDDDLTIALGKIRVIGTVNTLLLNENGGTYSSSGAFFAALQVGSTLLEIDGALLNGRINATRVEVEDHSGGSGSSSQVKIEGFVGAITPGTSFDLLITEIEKGAAIAGPVLTSLGNPATITVSFDPMTVFLSNSSTIVPSTALMVGQEVKVKFPTFVNPPFYAAKVEIEDEADHEADITDISGLPNSIVVHLDSDETAITSGLVASSSTDVTVQLTGSSLFLDVDAEPTISAGVLLVDLEVEVSGAITGPPTSPTITATVMEVHPGKMDGVVLATSPGMSSFTASLDSLDDPFGNTVVNPPFNILITPQCKFEEDVTTEAEFFALFTGLQQGEQLDVEIKGIGSGQPDEISAYEIKAKRN